MSRKDEIIDFIRTMVRKNKSDKVILERLRREKMFDISVSTLHRYKREFDIVRYDRSVTPGAVANAIQVRRAGIGLNAGVRSLQQILRNDGFLVTRRQVHDVVTVLTADAQRAPQRGVIERRLRYSPGPNYRWCVDGYDKLSPFGIYIHGCIDEYSRKLIWLRCYTTNRRPEIVVKYYLNAVLENGVAPECVVSDFGNECNTIATCQYFFHRHDIGPAPRHRWTYSIVNVTIEAFWRRLRAMSAQYWMNELQSLMQDGLWDGNGVDMACLYTVYLPIINDDLNRVMEQHNSHGIRKQMRNGRRPIRPSGVPEDIYAMPDLYGGALKGLIVNDIDVRHAMLHARIDALDLDDPVPADMNALISHWMSLNRVVVTVQNARTVYCQLRQMLTEHM